MKRSGSQVGTERATLDIGECEDQKRLEHGKRVVELEVGRSAFRGRITLIRAQMQ